MDHHRSFNVKSAPTKWDREDNKVLENLLTEYAVNNPRLIGEARRRIPHKTKEEIARHVENIEAGLVSLPDYDEVEEEDERSNEENKREEEEAEVVEEIEKALKEVLSDDEEEKGKDEVEEDVQKASEEAIKEEEKEKVEEERKPKKEATRWTSEEHERFLIGFKECGRSWAQIAREYVTTKTPSQVASHGRNYHPNSGDDNPRPKKRTKLAINQASTSSASSK